MCPRPALGEGSSIRPLTLRWSLPDTEERRELGLRLRLRLREGCGRGRAQSRCAAWTRYLGAYTSEILRTAGQQPRHGHGVKAACVGPGVWPCSSPRTLMCV